MKMYKTICGQIESSFCGITLVLLLVLGVLINTFYRANTK